EQLNRNSINLEIDKINAEKIEVRIRERYGADDVKRFYKDYVCTENLNEIWGEEDFESVPKINRAAPLFNL
ncbi:MAG TPA: hypothetical protein VGB00_12385, partial [Pyrinomonadaceae bacterium]